MRARFGPVVIFLSPAPALSSLSGDAIPGPCSWCRPLAPTAEARDSQGPMNTATPRTRHRHTLHPRCKAQPSRVPCTPCPAPYTGPRQRMQRGFARLLLLPVSHALLPIVRIHPPHVQPRAVLRGPVRCRPRSNMPPLCPPRSLALASAPSPALVMAACTPRRRLERARNDRGEWALAPHAKAPGAPPPPAKVPRAPPPPAARPPSAVRRRPLTWQRSPA